MNVEKAGPAPECSWTELDANRTAFSDTPTGDARIIFSNNNIASWSFRGTEAHDVPPTCPTITLVRIANDTTISTYDRRIILHEFGHLLGLLDEIQNPNAKIPWRPEIRADFAINYIYISQVEKCPAPLNRPLTYQEHLPHYRLFDPTSIMMALVGKEYVTEDVSYGGASDLSANDKEFVAQLYPKL
jgi:serralysin